jgi:hypothetical protein
MDRAGLTTRKRKSEMKRIRSMRKVEATKVVYSSLVWNRRTVSAVALP